MKEKAINLIKEIAFFAINGVRSSIYLLCLLFPIKNNKIFVNSFDGKGYGDNPKYILDSLYSYKKDIEVYWTNSAPVYHEFVKYIKPFSIKAIYHQATSKIWISTVRLPYYSVKRAKQFYFQTWHGALAFKKIEGECENALSPRYIRTCKHDSKMIDYYIAANEDNVNTILNYFWYTQGEILKFGSPRNDIFFNISNDLISSIKMKYNMDEDCKILLYAPTFRADNTFDAYNIDLESLKRLLEKYWGGKWKIVIRLHPRLANISNSFFCYNEEFINGSLIEDIQEFLTIVDGLITDYSSIAFDYMFTKRPIYIYASDIEEYTKDRDFHIKIHDTPFEISTCQKEIEDCIRLFDDTDYRNKLDTFLKCINSYEEGTASKRTAEVICDLLNK